MTLQTENSIRKRRETLRGLKDEDCPTVVPGSKTEQVVIGSLLGDGSITRGSFRESHCQEQKEVIDELARILSPFTHLTINQWNRSKTKGELPGVYIRNSAKRPEKILYCLRITVIPAFTALKSIWYPQKEKIVPDEILNKTGPQALAWWYIGDGSTQNYARFNTQGFSNLSNQKLIKILARFGFTSAKITPINRIALNREDSKNFFSLISEYVMPSMRYKLGEEVDTYKPYNTSHYDPEPVITEKMLCRSGGVLSG